MTKPAILEAVSLGRRHPDKSRWLLNGVSLEIVSGVRWAVQGPSGAGKSILLRLLSLLEPADSGEVLWLGSTVPNESVPRFRSQIMYLPQSASLFPGTVLENLQMPWTLGVHRADSLNRKPIDGMLDRLQRPVEFLDQPVDTLSGGERQIVAIMRAIQLQPLVLLLDEPTAALDERTTLAIEQLITEWLQEPESERTSVWVTHDSGQAERISDRVLQLEDGIPVTEVRA